MNALTGTGKLVRLILRRDRVLMPLWVLVIGLVPISYVASINQLFPMAAGRQQYADISAHNAGFVALYGRAGRVVRAPWPFPPPPLRLLVNAVPLRDRTMWALLAPQLARSDGCGRTAGTGRAPPKGVLGPPGGASAKGVPRPPGGAPAKGVLRPPGGASL